jgi:glycosyltransferase involved in cell wall biosynthesis
VRVLFISERFPPDRGGAAVSAARQALLLAETTERVDVLLLTAALPPARVDVDESGPCRVFRVGRAANGDESLQILYQTALNLAQAHGHDVLLGFYAVHAGYVATLVARALRRRSVVSLRGNDVDRAMFHGPRLTFLLWTLEHADALVGVSREILGKVTALTGRTSGLHRVPNSVDLAVFAPEGDRPETGEASRPFFGFFGELRLKKGLPILQDLAERLAREGRGTLYWVGGVREDEKAGVEAWQRAAPEAAARVREVPYERDPRRLAAWYRAMDLVLFPSLWEGMPNALLEAMACGRAALATAIGACPEVIADGVDGFLIPPARLSAFVETAWSLASSPDRLVAVGQMARARAVRELTAEVERAALLAALSATA